LFLSTPKGTSSLGGFDAPQVDDWDLKKKKSMTARGGFFGVNGNKGRELRDNFFRPL
jgi:hypothetical protein